MVDEPFRKTIAATWRRIVWCDALRWSDPFAITTAVFCGHLHVWRMGHVPGPVPSPCQPLAGLIRWPPHAAPLSPQRVPVRAGCHPDGAPQASEWRDTLPSGPRAAALEPALARFHAAVVQHGLLGTDPTGSILSHALGPDSNC